MRTLVIVFALLVGVALTVGVLWNAAEAHYQNCVLAAQALPSDEGYRARVQEQTGRDPHGKRVYARVQGCSRLP